MSEVKIASWNVNSVRARIDLLLSWISDRDPDVLLLQEIKAREEDFPYEAFDKFEYNIKIKDISVKDTTLEDLFKEITR